jgi:signal transduction histidine kinase
MRSATLAGPLPKKVSDAKVIATFELFCQLIRLQLDIAVVERIKRSGDRMARLIDNILDFARGRGMRMILSAWSPAATAR